MASYLSREHLVATGSGTPLWSSPAGRSAEIRVLQSPVVWTDDTPVTVLVVSNPAAPRPVLGLHRRSFHPYSVYDFTMSRSRDGPADIPRGLPRFLQADAFSGYDGIFLGSSGTIVEVACWAHARRKFYDARSQCAAG